MNLVPSALPSAENIRNILVATDFSAHARTGLVWAIELARAHRAQVTLVHAADTELPASVVAPNVLAQKIEKSLENLRQHVSEAGVAVRSEYHMGKPWVIVPAVAKKIGADVIVLGARGETNFAGRLLGSTADRIIRTTSTPTIIVRPEFERRPTAIQSVLVACDFSEESARATSMAVKLLHKAEETVHLVLFHVLPLNIPYPDPSFPAHSGMADYLVTDPECWNEMERQASRNLETLAAPLRSERVQVEVKTARGFPGNEIVREAASIEAQLIAVGTHGLSGINRLFVGSVAEWVLHHAQCPVLTVRKPDPAEPILVSTVP